MRKEIVPGLPGDGSDEIAINKLEDWPKFLRDQWEWNAQMLGVAADAPEPDYTTEPDEPDTPPAGRLTRIRHWFGRMFEEIGKSYPADAFYTPF